MAYSERAIKLRERFLRSLFARGEIYRQSFKKLCDAGCQPDDLASLLSAMCTLSRFQQFSFQESEVAQRNRITESELRGLPASLRSLADLLERVNKTPLAPQTELSAMTEDSQKHSKSAMLARLYRMLPGLMRAYGRRLENFSETRRRAMKRLTMNHVLVLQFLLYVEESTGKPYYSDVANLLDGGFWTAAGPQAEPPKFFTSEALAKLRRRNAHLGVQPFWPPTPARKPEK